VTRLPTHSGSFDVRVAYGGDSMLSSYCLYIRCTIAHWVTTDHTVPLRASSADHRAAETQTPPSMGSQGTVVVDFGQLVEIPPESQESGELGPSRGRTSVDRPEAGLASRLHTQGL
jgi:hypothetical protein